MCSVSKHSMSKIKNSRKKSTKKSNESLQINTATITILNYEAITGQEPLTTYFTDFSFADNTNNVESVKCLYTLILNDAARNGYKHLTELTIILCYKTWEHYNSNEELFSTYNELFELTKNYAWATLKDDELKYFYRMTD